MKYFKTLEFDCVNIFYQIQIILELLIYYSLWFCRKILIIIQLRTVRHTMFTYVMYKWGNQIGTYLRPIYGGRNIHFFKLDSVHNSDPFMKAAVITCAWYNALMEVGRFPKIYTQNTLISNWASAYFTYFMRIGISIYSKKGKN